MNWKIEGKVRDKPARLTMIGGPDTEDALREQLAGTHPGFTIERLTELDGTLKPIQQPEPEPQTEETE